MTVLVDAGFEHGLELEQGLERLMKNSALIKNTAKKPLAIPRRGDRPLSERAPDLQIGGGKKIDIATISLLGEEPWL